MRFQRLPLLVEQGLRFSDAMAADLLNLICYIFSNLSDDGDTRLQSFI